jgi:hypothetical protein
MPIIEDLAGYGRGRPRVDDRRVINGMSFTAKTGVA